MKFEDIKIESQAAFMPTYARYDFAPVRGQGATLYDENSKDFIDFTSGIGVNALGYGHPAWVKAVGEQAASLQHISNLYYAPAQTKLAKKLVEASGFAGVFLANSGAEANECAIKLARKYSFDKYGQGRGKIVSLENSFHGRTLSTLKATGQEDFHKYFYPFPQGFAYTPPNDIEALKNALTPDVCALIIEIIQGEGGVLPLDSDFIKAARRLTHERDILLIMDEVQTGLGRTGKLFAWEYIGQKPDVLTAAKGLGNGLPIGACLCSEELKNVLGPGDHGSTFGGNPIASAGATVVLDSLTEEFMADVMAKGQLLGRMLAEIPIVEEVRGMGLMLGIKLKNIKAKDLAAKCLQEGLLVLTAKENLRLLPPLNISREEIETGMQRLKKAAGSI
ncbi:MAG: aspartate aminotransferase family protein [Clostridiales bacterium]|nr:aspartate aminotransferase family protein [Clostridiales bacterium]